MMNFDIGLFYFINNNCSNFLFDRLMPFVSLMGGGEGIALVAVLMMVLLKEWRKFIGILLLAGLTLSYYSAGILKIMICRPRPFVTLAGVHQLVKEGSFSFPSGHATEAFMAAFILASFFGRRWLFFSAAACVAFSRVYAGVHYPSDVISGAALGAALGYIIVRITNLVKKDLDSEMFSHER